MKSQPKRSAFRDIVALGLVAAVVVAVIASPLLVLKWPAAAAAAVAGMPVALWLAHRIAGPNSKVL